MSKPLVSVVIPNYNYARYLNGAIDCALTQSHENVEVIVVDDGSADNSRSIIEGYGDKIKAIFQSNAGVSAARNNGAKLAAGEYIAFLDADDIWFAEKLEKQVGLFELEKNLGLVHVGVEEFDDEGNTLKIRLDGMSGDVSHELLLFERSVVLGGGSGMMIPRDVFEQVGGFDLNLLTSADWDLFYRVSTKHKIGFVPEVLLKYRIHGSNMHGNINRMEDEMLYGFEKAFKLDPKVSRRVCYGNLHLTLAGSYFHVGQYFDFFRHTVKSIYFRPSNFLYFASFPFRSFRKKK